jgi:hypothetical protein
MIDCIGPLRGPPVVEFDLRFEELIVAREPLSFERLSAGPDPRRPARGRALGRGPAAPSSAWSPFTFFRGAAYLMAADLAGPPRTGLQVQLCGDAHLSNFGGFAAPDRRLVFSINDFDGTLPGPFEWTSSAWWPASPSPAGIEASTRNSGSRSIAL